MDNFKENIEKEIQINQEFYVRKLEKENVDLKNKLDSLLFNLNIVARLTTDKKTSSVITDIITAIRQNSLTI